jgi:hypothetical protein
MAVKAAAGGGAAFVFASRADDLPENDKQLNKVFAHAKYSNFGCTACGTHMQARSDTSPFCVTCGSGDKVHQVKANSEARITSSSELTSLQCSVCDHATVLETAVVKSITASGRNHPVHCSCCGKPMFAMQSSGDAEGEGGSEKADRINPGGPANNRQNSLVVPDEPPAIEAAGEEDDLDSDDDGDIDIEDLEAAFMRAASEPGAEFDKEADLALDDKAVGNDERVNAADLDNFKGKQAKAGAVTAMSKDEIRTMRAKMKEWGFNFSGRTITKETDAPHMIFSNKKFSLNLFGSLSGGVMTTSLEVTYSDRDGGADFSGSPEEQIKEITEFAGENVDSVSKEDAKAVCNAIKFLQNYVGKQKVSAAGLDADDLVVDDDLALESDADDLVLEPFTMEEDFGDDVLDEPIAEISTTEFAADDEFDLPDTEGDPLADAMELDDTDMALAFVRASGRVIAMKGHVAIASFSKKTAGKNAFLINSDALPAAAKAAVHSEGLRAGLESIGFKLIRVPVQSSLLADKKVAAIQASVAKKEDDRKREFAGIFALAAAGLNRGNWRGIDNPIRAALVRELENIGVERPARVAARVLEESGLQYSQTLLEVSNKLSKMSASARKDMAEALEMTNVVASAEAEDDGEETPVSSALEARLNRPALLRPVLASTSKGISGASAILAGKAPLSFASA